MHGTILVDFYKLLDTKAPSNKACKTSLSAVKDYPNNLIFKASLANYARSAPNCLKFPAWKSLSEVFKL